MLESESLNVIGDVEEEPVLRKEEQLDVMSIMREATVVLSATTWNVVALVELETKLAYIMTPPVREVLSGLPYCIDQ